MTESPSTRPTRFKTPKQSSNEVAAAWVPIVESGDGDPEQFNQAN